MICIGNGRQGHLVSNLPNPTFGSRHCRSAVWPLDGQVLAKTSRNFCLSGP